MVIWCVVICVVVCGVMRGFAWFLSCVVICVRGGSGFCRDMRVWLCSDMRV